jgi:6-phosphogluconolactonase
VRAGEEAGIVPKTPASAFAYVGSRTTRERNARGDGINVYRIDGETNAWAHVQLVPGLLNPSFLALDRSRRFLYAVHGDASEISAFRIDPATGKLAFVNRVTTGGKNPVHLSVDPSNGFVLVANHLSSSIAVLPRREDDGSLGEPVQLMALEGEPGPHRAEQPFSKPHQVEFDQSGRFVAIPDKGLDRTFTFIFDPEAGRLAPTPAPPAAARECAGPRHVAFHPTNRYAYVVNELDSTVTAHRFDPGDGGLTPFQVVPALPDGFFGRSRAAAIVASRDGRFVYVSNRGHDSIAAFSVAGATGRLKSIGWASSAGRTPRFLSFTPVGDALLIANEDSDRVVALTVDQRTGKLTRRVEVARTGSPVCIMFDERR